MNRQLLERNNVTVSNYCIGDKIILVNKETQEVLFVILKQFGLSLSDEMLLGLEVISKYDDPTNKLFWVNPNNSKFDFRTPVVPNAGVLFV